MNIRGTWCVVRGVGVTRRTEVTRRAGQQGQSQSLRVGQGCQLCAREVEVDRTATPTTTASAAVAAATCLGHVHWAEWAVDSGGHFWAKNDGMRSEHRHLVTKPAGARAGARSREKGPARTPPLLVEFHSSQAPTFVLIPQTCFEQAHA